MNLIISINAALDLVLKLTKEYRSTSVAVYDSRKEQDSSSTSEEVRNDAQKLILQ